MTASWHGSKSIQTPMFRSVIVAEMERGGTELLVSITDQTIRLDLTGTTPTTGAFVSVTERSNNIFYQAQRAYEEPLDDDPGPLDDKPKGWCPWCGSPVKASSETPDFTEHERHRPAHCKWDREWPEDDNRARYVREREADDKIEAKIARESRKRGSHD